MNPFYALLGTALLACGSGKSPSECRAQAEELGTFLMTTPHGSIVYVKTPELELVKRTGLTARPDETSMILTVTRKDVMFRGMPVRTLDEVIDRVRRLRPGLDHAELQIDRATPWSKVVELVDGLRGNGFTKLGLEFDNGATLPPPPRSSVDDKLDAIINGPDDNERAVKIAKLAEDVIKDCPALMRDMGRVSSETAESKADVIIKSLAPALIECGCDVEMPALRSIMWRLTNSPPNVNVITFDPNTGDKLALPGATTWDDASKRFKPGTSYQLAVE